MARFKYRMQSILDVKTKLETQAKQEFSAAKAALDEELDKMEQLKERKAGYEARAEELLCGTLRLQEIQDNKAAILKMDEYIQEQKVRIKRAEKKLEAARVKLTELMQERKMHEKLKEKAFEEFLEEEKKQEGKEVDELTSYTYGQRIQEKAKQESNRGKEEVNG
ncbi:MAG: flagellar export protein FliJ [Lachnospiraceae bacterium]|nr:flagellar export protein FliJ [Lachnospiraceae bacterium]